MLTNYIDSFEQTKDLARIRQRFLIRLTFQKWVEVRPRLREKKVMADMKYDDIVLRFRKVGIKN